MSNTKKSVIIGALVVAIFSIFSCLLYGYVVLQHFPFELKDSLEEWREYRLKGKVQYWIDFDSLGGFVRAKSQNSCSSKYRWMKIDMKNEPVVSWRWKVLRFPKKDLETEKNDFAARIYIIFPGFSFGSSEFLEYTWDEFKPIETVYVYPDANNVQQIVAESGKADAENWHYVSRNIYNDYIKAFGCQPPHKAGILALMCDSDDTQDEAEAFFDEIKIEYTK